MKPRNCVLLAVLLAMAGCGGPLNKPASQTGGYVFGPCRFCKKPGYSDYDGWNTPVAQKAADSGDREVLGTVVCRECRIKMGLLSPATESPVPAEPKAPADTKGEEK